MIWLFKDIGRFVNTPSMKRLSLSLLIEYERELCNQNVQRNMLEMTLYMYPVPTLKRVAGSTYCLLDCLDWNPELPCVLVF